MNIRKFRYREYLYKRLFLLQDIVKLMGRWVESFLRLVFILTIFLFIGVVIFHLGFEQPEHTVKKFTTVYRVMLTILLVSKILNELINYEIKSLWSRIFETLVVLMVIAILWINREGFSTQKPWLDIFRGNIPLTIAIVVLLATETYRISSYINALNIHPSLLFASSFLIMIFIGSLLLYLPTSTVHRQSFLDILFTSTSAVCVTGLTVVDTSSAFSPLGKTILIVLIQAGGLGIMAFTGFFGYIFKGTASLRDRLVLKDIVSGDSLSGMFRLLMQIFFITLLTEAIGAALIFLNIHGTLYHRFGFSVFHAISAFCNAGFSTLPQGMHSSSVLFNTHFQLVIASLIILGGIGFPVLLNLYKYIRYLLSSVYLRIIGKRVKHYPRIVNSATRIVLRTTMSLLVFGTIAYYLFEKNASLSTLDTGHSLIVSFFGSVSARTAGFNVADLSRWTYPTLFLMIFLMWVGASPGSTGGGIKTTSFSLALRMAVSFCRGRSYVEIGGREIAYQTVIRVLAIILLSMLVIAIGFITLLIFEPLKNPVHLLFETVSAFGTVGLSVANTSTLSSAGKIVIIFMMFIGRIGPLTLLTGIFTSHRKKHYRLPEENIIIN